MGILLRKQHALQDYTTISSVGSASQQMAGHRPLLTDPNTSGELALYYFGDAGGAITLDEKGTYSLTNVGSTPQAAGIFGGSTGAASFNGSTQWFTAGALLGTTPSAIAIDCWFMSNDGQPASTNCLFAKRNSAGVDQCFLTIESNGAIQFTATRSSTAKTIISTTILPNNTTGWYHVTATWDTTNGTRLWVNGILEAQDSSATTLMASGSGDNFAIGSLTTAGTWFWNGKIAYLRVRNKVLTQADVDVAYSTKYTWPTLTDLPIATSMIVPYVQEGGNSSLVSQLNWGGMECARDSLALYRYGGLFSATDKLKLVIKE